MIYKFVLRVSVCIRIFGNLVSDSRMAPNKFSQNLRFSAIVKKRFLLALMGSKKRGTKPTMISYKSTKKYNDL